MCNLCCVNCGQRICVCQKLFSDLAKYPFFSGIIGFTFNKPIDRKSFKNSLTEIYDVSEDDSANRKQSQTKKESGKRDHMYHSLTIKNSFYSEVAKKKKNICFQLSDHHARLLLPGWENCNEIVIHYMHLMKKTFPQVKIETAKIVSMNMSYHWSNYLNAKNNLDMFIVRKILEEHGRNIRKDFRPYFNPKVNSDKAVTIEFKKHQGKLRIFSTGTVMAMGVNEPIFMKEQLLYFSEFINKL